MTELDSGDPAELAQLYHEIRSSLPHLNVIGGCCGTDIRHVTAIAECCASRGTGPEAVLQRTGPPP